jgi:hypothetical protein
VRTASGAALARSQVNNGVGVTGQSINYEVDQVFFRGRNYSPDTGSFTSRNIYLQDPAPRYFSPIHATWTVGLTLDKRVIPIGVYVDGLSQYFAAFASVQAVDPSGQPVGLALGGALAGTGVGTSMSAGMATAIVGTGAVVGLVANAILGPSITGKCNDSEYNSLKADVDSACHGDKFGCKMGMSCAQLERNKRAAGACLRARARINARCFDGGDPGHQNALADVIKSLINCQEIREKSGCCRDD